MLTSTHEVNDRNTKVKNRATNVRGAEVGFTLVELLMVLAVLAVLAALLLPALIRAKAAAQSAACKSNLRQLGIALNLYVTDYGKYPGPRPTRNEAQYYGLGDWLFPYLSIPAKDGWLLANNANSGILKCPAKPPAIIPGLFPDSPSARVYYDGYGYNQFGTERLDPPPSMDLGLGYRIEGHTTPLFETAWQIHYISEANVRAPSDMLAFGDVKGWSQLISPRGGFVADHHRGGVNFAFCDGHVEYGKQSKWIEATDSARPRWNNDHQPHSETW